MSIAVFDIETKELVSDWEQPHLSGIASVAVWTGSRGAGSMHVFSDGELHKVQHMLQSASVVVSFNGIGFDLPLLSGCLKAPLQLQEHFDLMRVVQEITGRRYSLDELARCTLGQGKTGHGMSAPVLYRESNFARLHTYNIKDVELTRDLFFFLLSHGYVLVPYKDGVRQVSTPWSMTSALKGQHRLHRPVHRKDERKPATQKQIDYLKDLHNYDWKPTENLTSAQAAEMIDYLKKGERKQ